MEKMSPEIKEIRTALLLVGYTVNSYQMIGKRDRTWALFSPFTIIRTIYPTEEDAWKAAEKDWMTFRTD